MPAADDKRKLKDAGLFAAPFQGAAHAVRGLGKTGQTLVGGTPTAEEPKTVAEQPLGWGDILSPKVATEKILYGLGESAPELIGGIGGGMAGTALAGRPRTPFGVAGRLVRRPPRPRGGNNAQTRGP